MFLSQRYSFYICGDFNIYYKEWLVNSKLMKKANTAKTSPSPSPMNWHRSLKNPPMFLIQQDIKQKYLNSSLHSGLFLLFLRVSLFAPVPLGNHWRPPPLLDISDNLLLNVKVDDKTKAFPDVPFHIMSFGTQKLTGTASDLIWQKFLSQISSNILPLKLLPSSWNGSFLE